MLTPEQRKELLDKIVTPPDAKTIAPLCAVSGQAWQGKHYITVHIGNGHKVRVISKYARHFTDETKAEYAALLTTPSTKKSTSKVSEES